MGGTTSPAMTFAEYFAGAVVLRCERSEPRRMGNSGAVALRDAALCAAPQGDGRVSYPGTTAASLTATDASTSSAPSPQSAGCALASPRTAGRLLPAWGRACRQC